MALPYRVYSVQEIKDLAAQYQIPMAEVCHFYIDMDFRGPKAYGIYYDEGIQNWVVYKNKANGDRAIRYSGVSEREASQIIWDKFLEEIRKRPEISRVLLYNDYPDDCQMNERDNYTRQTYTEYNDYKKPKSVARKIPVIAGATVAGLAVIGMVVSEDDGYYFHEASGHYYYHLDDTWYIYDSELSNGWRETQRVPDKDGLTYLGGSSDDALDNFVDDFGDYYYDYLGPMSIDVFEDTVYYMDWFDSEYESDSWSSDSDWGSDWDSDWGSDWGSDWDSDW